MVEDVYSCLSTADCNTKGDVFKLYQTGHGNNSLPEDGQTVTGGGRVWSKDRWRKSVE